MFKTAIAHVEGQLSYDEALNNFRTAFPDYEVRGIKQSNVGWIAFIQKEAYQDNPEGYPAVAEEDTSPGADDESMMMEVEVGEGEEESYEEEEAKQGDLIEELEEAIDKVERLVDEIKDSEADEDEVRPFEEDEEMEDLLAPELAEELEMEEEGMGMEKEMPLMIAREKEAGVSFNSATREVQKLIRTEKEFRGYKLAGVEEKKDRFVAKLVKKN